VSLRGVLAGGRHDRGSWQTGVADRLGD